MATVLAYKTSLLLLLALSGGSVAGMTYYYQGQTANLNNEINNLGNGITSSNGQIANLTSQISKLKAEIASLNQSLQTLPLVNEVPRNVAIRVEWVNTFNSNQDRFYPEYITVAQGDNLSLVFISNDTSDAHTFTISLSYSMNSSCRSEKLPLRSPCSAISKGMRQGTFCGQRKQGLFGLRFLSETRVL